MFIGGIFYMFGRRIPSNWHILTYFPEVTVNYENYQVFKVQQHKYSKNENKSKKQKFRTLEIGKYTLKNNIFFKSAIQKKIIEKKKMIQNLKKSLKKPKVEKNSWLKNVKKSKVEIQKFKKSEIWKLQSMFKKIENLTSIYLLRI